MFSDLFSRRESLLIASALCVALLAGCTASEQSVERIELDRAIETDVATFSVSSKWLDTDLTGQEGKMESGWYNHSFSTQTADGKKGSVTVHTVAYFKRGNSIQPKSLDEYWQAYYSGSCEIEEELVIDGAAATRFSFDLDGQKGYGVFLLRDQSIACILGTDKAAIDAVVGTLDLKEYM